MKKWAAALALASAVWMIAVLATGSFFLAMISNYPGVFAARWVQYRGIAPSSTMIWGFNLWLAITSAIEWMAVGLGLRAVLRHLLKSRSRHQHLPYSLHHGLSNYFKRCDRMNLPGQFPGRPGAVFSDSSWCSASYGNFQFARTDFALRIGRVVDACVLHGNSP